MSINNNTIMKKYNQIKYELYFKSKGYRANAPLPKNDEVRIECENPNGVNIGSGTKKNYTSRYCLNIKTIDLCKILTKKKPQNSYIYEYTNEYTPLKLFLDIDSHTEKFNESILNQFLKSIESKFKITWYYTECISQRYKKGVFGSYTSRHYTSNLKLKNTSQLKKFKNYFLSILGTNKDIIDFGVFRTSGLMRAPYQSKNIKDEKKSAKHAGFNSKLIKDTALKPVGGFNIEKYLITVFDGSEIDITEEQIQFLDSFKDNKISTIIVHKPDKLPTSARRKINPLTCSSWSLIKSIHPHKNFLNMSGQFLCMLYAKKNDVVFDSFYNWLDQGYSGGHERWRKKWQQNWNNQNKNKIKVRRNTILNIYEKQYGDTDRHHIQPFISQFLTLNDIDYIINKNQKYVESLKPYPQKDFWNHKHNFHKLINGERELYLRDLIKPWNCKNEKDPRKSDVAILCDLGQGKTYASLKYLKYITDINKDDRPLIFILTNRITLANSIYGDIINNDELYMDVSHYKKDKHLIQERHAQRKTRYNVYIIEIESLYKYESWNPDIIMIDEVESIEWSFLTNSCMGTHYQDNATIFMDFIKNSKNNIIMDALMSKRTLKFFNSILQQRDIPEKLFLINTSKKNIQNRKYTIYKPNKQTGSHAFYAWMDHLIDSINKGEKPLIFYPYKMGRGSALKISIDKLGDMILSNCPDIEPEDIATYYSGAPDVEGTIEEVNKYWSKYKIVISNSCITTGVSFSVKDENQFDGVWLVYADFVTPREVIQFSNRARHIKSNMIHLVEAPQIQTEKEDTDFEPKRTEIPEEYKDITEELYKDLIKEFECKNMRCLEYLFKYSNIHRDKEVFCKNINKHNYKEIERNTSEEDRFSWNSIPDISFYKYHQYCKQYDYELKPFERERFNKHNFKTRIQPLGSYTYPTYKQVKLYIPDSNDKFYEHAQFWGGYKTNVCYINVFKVKTGKEDYDNEVKDLWDKQAKVKLFQNIFTEPLLQGIITPTEQYINKELEHYKNDEKIRDYKVEEHDLIKFNWNISKSQKEYIERRLSGIYNNNYSEAVFKHFFPYYCKNQKRDKPIYEGSKFIPFLYNIINISSRSLIYDYIRYDLDTYEKTRPLLLEKYSFLEKRGIRFIKRK